MQEIILAFGCIYHRIIYPGIIYRKPSGQIGIYLKIIFIFFKGLPDLRLRLGFLFISTAFIGNRIR